MKYRIYASRFDVPEEPVKDFEAATDEAAKIELYRLKAKPNYAWDNLRLVEVVLDQKLVTRPVDAVK